MKLDLAVQLCEGTSLRTRRRGDSPRHQASQHLAPRRRRCEASRFRYRQVVHGDPHARKLRGGQCRIHVSGADRRATGRCRSDLFSVGAVLFELIAGRPPFDGDSVTAVMMKIVQDEPAPDIRMIAPDTPATLASVISRALEKDPDRRYADAAEMAADLRAVRVEIAEQEEPHADRTTTTNDVRSEVARNGSPGRWRPMPHHTFPPTVISPAARLRADSSAADPRGGCTSTTLLRPPRSHRHFAHKATQRGPHTSDAGSRLPQR